MGLEQTNGDWYFQDSYKSPKISVSNSKLFELLSIFDAFNTDEREDDFIENNYPLLGSYSYYDFTKGLKQYFSQEELTQFYLFLKQHSPWTYMCLTKESEVGKGITYRGFEFFVIELSSKVQRQGLRQSSSSWVQNGNTQRPSSVYQIEILKLHRKGASLEERFEPQEVLFFGYEPCTYYKRNQTVLFDTVLIKAKLV